MTGHSARADGQGRVYQASGDQYIFENHHHGPNWSGPDTVRLPSVGRVPVVLRDRLEEMGQLRAGLAEGAGGRIFVLHGMGGCGKTAVAYSLFQHATSVAGRVGLWVDASDPTSLRSGMLAVAADRGAADGELAGVRSGLRPAADFVWQYLDRSESPWLLVLDNADSPAFLRDGGWLRASTRGLVVVTTRQSAAHWWPSAKLLRFGVLPRDDAALVLQDLAPQSGTIEEAEQLADRLGRLPLALTLAGGFLAQQVINPWSLADYENRLEAETEGDTIELIERGADKSTSPRHLPSRTWQLSLDGLAAGGTPEAGHLLSLLCCLSSAPLPVLILMAGEIGPELQGSRVESALRGLLDHSLLELVKGEARCLRVHGVLLESVARAVPVDQRSRLVARVTSLLLAVLPESPDRGSQEQHVLLLAPHVVSLARRAVKWRLDGETAERVAESAVRVITAVHRSSDYASALTLSNQLIDLLTPILNEGNVWRSRLKLRKGQCLFRLGRFEDAALVCRGVLQDFEASLGLHSVDTLEACRNLANVLINLDRREEGVDLYRRAYRGLATALGTTHPLTLVTGVDLLEASPHQEEISRGAELVDQCRRELGEMHSVTLAAELGYGLALKRAEMWMEALPYVQSTEAKFAEKYGRDYPITLNARQLLGSTLYALGRKVEAIEILQAVVAGKARVMGPGHPWTHFAQETLDRFRAS